ncbi:unannotated protein [freshwater metagenome]|uniref:Unannotated protein n=1 Tax=freshwater metagenome TaxID=449393 RepID=A0A6J7NF68_9ZZZZ
MVGSSSNALEITGAPPMLSPTETVKVLFTVLRSAARAVASTAAPMVLLDASIAPWKSLNSRNWTLRKPGVALSGTVTALPAAFVEKP